MGRFGWHDHGGAQPAFFKKRRTGKVMFISTVAEVPKIMARRSNSRFSGGIRGLAGGNACTGVNAVLDSACWPRQSRCDQVLSNAWGARSFRFKRPGSPPGSFPQHCFRRSELELIRYRPSRVATYRQSQRPRIMQGFVSRAAVLRRSWGNGSSYGGKYDAGGFFRWGFWRDR